MQKVYKNLIVKTLVLLSLFVSWEVANAQSDSFFHDWSNVDINENDDIVAPGLPGHGYTTDQGLPLGDGLVALAVFSVGYLLLKKKRQLVKVVILVMTLVPAAAESQEVDVEWVVTHDYPNTMVGYAIVVVDGQEMFNAQYEIGAFVGDECRGKALCNTVGGGHYEASLSVCGKDGDVLTFKVMDHNNNWVVFADCPTTIDFVTEGVFASPKAPLEVSLTTIKYYFNGGDVDDISNYTLSNGNPVAKLPLRNCTVEMRGAASYTEGNTEVKDVIIGAGGSVVIAAGSGLAAVDKVENPEGVKGILIEAKAPHTGTKGEYWEEKFSSVGSLVSLSSGVSGTMQTYLDNSSRIQDWHLISSPVSSQLIYDGLTETDFAPGTNDDFYLWDETTATWCNIKTDEFSVENQFHNINNNSFDFVPGCGYLASYRTAKDKAYEGTFNNGDVTVALTKTDLINETPNPYIGFNLIGNPYPSFLDWENAEGWDRSKIYGYNTDEPAESRCVMWIYNEDEGNYSVYVQGGGGISTLHGTRYIAPGQGFFVKATQTGFLVMRDAARTNEHSESGFMKGAKGVPARHYMNNRVHGGEADMCPAADNKIMKIRVENEKLGSDEVALAISGKEMKVEKLFGMSETAPAMYFNEDGGKYSIIIDDDFENSIPLSFKAKQIGKYTIKLNTESYGFDFVELEDSFTGKKVNLLTEGYSFYATGNDDADRFRLNLRINGNDDDSQNFVCQNGNDLIVRGKGNLQVIDLLGRTIFEKELTSEENVISCDYINKGVNIFKLGNKAQKIVIR